MPVILLPLPTCLPACQCSPDTLLHFDVPAAHCCPVTVAGLQIKNLDASALRASFAMLEQHFPERILDIWMLEAPTIFWGLWKLVSPFIDP